MTSGDRDKLWRGLDHEGVQAAAHALRQSGDLGAILRFGAALARSVRQDDEAERLMLEAEGFGDQDDQLPEHRFVLAFATPFPLRSLDTGLLDPEEVFLTNADKFARVRFGLKESAERLEEAAIQVEAGGVLSLRVPAREVAGEAADVPEDADVHLYVLARDLSNVVEGIRRVAHETLIERLLDAAEDTGRSAAS